MNYWLHRISHLAEISYPLLDMGYLTIGFSDFSSERFVKDILKPDTWQKRWEIFESYFADEWGEHPRTRHNLWRFIEGFKKGDRVVVPTWWGKFSVYELAGDKPQAIAELPSEQLQDWHGTVLKVEELIKTNDGSFADIGFFWKVIPLETDIPRYEYADAALTARMKIRNTNTGINDLKENVQIALKAYKENKPINLYAKIMDAAVEHVFSILRSELSANKLEYLIKWYFERVGASGVYIPAKNEAGKEGDADVIATFEPIRTIIYTQAKFHKEITPDWAVQQIIDYKKNMANANLNKIESMDDDYSRINWVISTADGFSDEAIKLAKEEKVQLINGRKFAVMLLEAGITNINMI